MAIMENIIPSYRIDPCNAVGISYITEGQVIIPVTTDGKAIKGLMSVEVTQRMNEIITITLTAQVKKYNRQDELPYPPKQPHCMEDDKA